MQCPSCSAELSPDDIRKRICSQCREGFVVGQWRITMLLAGLAVGGLAVYTYTKQGADGWLGVGLLSLMAVLLLLRARR